MHAVVFIKAVILGVKIGIGSLVPRPAPQLLSLAARKAIFLHSAKKSCGVELGNEAKELGCSQ